MPHAVLKSALPALAALLLGGCVVQEPPATYSTAPAYQQAPAYAAQGYQAPGYAAQGYQAPGYSVSGAPVAAPPLEGGGYAAAASADPYCREAMAEARSASRDARMAARDARLGSYAGAPPWAQQQDSERAASAAARADRTRSFAARDC
jgi:hypothetical protein